MKQQAGCEVKSGCILELGNECEANVSLTILERYNRGSPLFPPLIKRTLSAGHMILLDVMKEAKVRNQNLDHPSLEYPKILNILRE
jgi:hypothetical protein